MLEAGAKDVPADRDLFLGHIKAESVRLGRLMRALLVLARAQTGEEAPRLSSVELAPVLDEAVSGLEPAPGVALHVDCPTGLEVLTERDLAVQVVANLAANAIKHTAAGSVRVAARDVGHGAVEIEVADTGEGMPAAVRERIFDRFYRAGDRDERGFGLGLAIVREAVRAIGGVVEVETSPGAGTVARVRLPAAGAQAA
jgi:signal transduction histidine kinase